MSQTQLVFFGNDVNETRRGRQASLLFNNTAKVQLHLICCMVDLTINGFSIGSHSLVIQLFRHCLQCFVMTFIFVKANTTL